MAVTSLEVPFRADRGARADRAGIRWWDRHGWPPLPLPVIIGVLLLVVLAVAGARIDYAANYQPLIFSGTFGPVTASGFKPVSDGFETTRWLLVAKPGATATFTYGLYNTGNDAVTIYDVPNSPDGYVYTSMAWAPADYRYPDFSNAHRLPAIVAPHHSIQLLLSIRKPACDSPGAAYRVDTLTIHYRALGVSHTWATPMFGETLQPIEVCWNPPSS